MGGRDRKGEEREGETKTERLRQKQREREKSRDRQTDRQREQSSDNSRVHSNICVFTVSDAHTHIVHRSLSYTRERQRRTDRESEGEL